MNLLLGVVVVAAVVVVVAVDAGQDQLMAQLVHSLLEPTYLGIEPSTTTLFHNQAHHLCTCISEILSFFWSNLRKTLGDILLRQT